MEAGDQVVLTDTKTNKGDLGKAIESAGYVLGPGVSKKTKLLVAGDPEGETSKARKAREYGIPILGEYDFIERFLTAGVKPDINMDSYLAPNCASELLLMGKRDVKGLKEALGMLRDGLELDVQMKHPEHGEFVIRGPVRYSPLGEAWLIGALPIGTRTAPDKVTQKISLAAATPPEPPTPGYVPQLGDIISARFTQNSYGTFTIFGPVTQGIGTHLKLASWWLDGAPGETIVLIEPDTDL